LRLLFFFLIAGVLPLSAELRKLEMRVGGLDCDSCAVSVDRIIKRIRGVDSASFDAKANLVSVTFKPANKVGVDAIRDAVTGVGYTPGETQLSARGSLVSEDGKWRFKPAGLDRTYAAEFPSGLQPKAADDVVVEGSLPAPSGGNQPETLRVKSVRKAE
jgi:copper chaperone CopZ